MTWIHPFSKSICTKLNATTNLEFELGLLFQFYALISVTLPTHPRYSRICWYQSKNSRKMFLQDKLCRVARTKKDVVQQRKKWTLFISHWVLTFWCNITIFILILLHYLYTAIMLCKISLPFIKTDCKFFFQVLHHLPCCIPLNLVHCLKFFFVFSLSKRAKIYMVGDTNTLGWYDVLLKIPEWAVKNIQNDWMLSRQPIKFSDLF